MGHITGEQIQAALDTGKPVWSQAMGRMGLITGVEGNTVSLKCGRSGRGQDAVTWFNDGDHVKLVEYEKRWVICNDFDAQFGAMRERRVAAPSEQEANT